VDGRHGRAGQFGQTLVDALAAGDGIVDRATAVELLELFQVGAGNETRCLAGLQHHGLGWVQRDPFEQAAQFQQHVLRHRIDSGAGAVKGQHHYAVVADVRVPVREAKPVEA